MYFYKAETVAIYLGKHKSSVYNADDEVEFKSFTSKVRFLKTI